MENTVTPIETQNTTYIEQRPNYFSNINEKLVDIIENLISVEKKEDISSLLNDKFLNLDFGAEYSIDSSKIGIIDASFFINLLNVDNSITYTINDEKLSILTDGKKVDITPSLTNVLNASISTNKPIRLDFDKDITVILKLDKDGNIQTHFVPGSAEVESFLKQNLGCLKQRFDENEINYSYLGYSKYKEDENQKRNKKGEK